MKQEIKNYLLVLISAVLLSWSFPSFHWHVLAWVALIPLFALSTYMSPGRIALYFFVCGHIFHSLTLQWLCANIFWAGGWAIIGQQLLCLVLSLCWVVVGVVWGTAYRWSSRYGGAVCLAGLWVGMELFQSLAFTGFGWCALGYSQGANLFVAQWASIGSVSLLSFFIVLINALVALALVHSNGRWKRSAAAIGLLILIHVVGMGLLKETDYTEPHFRVGIVQPNFPQEMKWDPAYDVDMLQRTVQVTRSLVEKQRVDLVVWPEALIVRHFENPLYKEVLSNMAADLNVWLFTGAVREEYATSKSYNSSALFNPQGEVVGVYDKVHLAAFGEYVPLERYFPFLGQIAFGGVSPGSEQKTFAVGDRTMGPLICFEVLFPPMAEYLRRKGADMLVVITNLGWFGASNAIPQELEIARLRAIETRLPVIHSANTGISGAFDPYGRFIPLHYIVAGKGDLIDIGDTAQPHHLVMRRFTGSLPVAVPAQLLIPFGPSLFPWIGTLLGLILVAVAIGQRFVGDISTNATEQVPAKVSKKKEGTPGTKRKPRKKASPKAVTQEDPPHQDVPKSGET